MQFLLGNRNINPHINVNSERMIETICGNVSELLVWRIKMYRRGHGNCSLVLVNVEICSYAIKLHLFPHFGMKSKKKTH